MELEITIRVPLGTSGVSVEQHTTEPADANPNGAAAPPSPSTHLGAMPGPEGGTPEVLLSADVEGGHAHEPPSPADFGLTPGGAGADAGPPPLEVIERVVAEATSASGQPPGVDDLRVPDILGHDGEAVAGPPDLPDPSQVPDVSAEFAPPPIDDPGSPSPPGKPGSSGGSGKRRG
jgi:hypothetical protein